MSVYVDEPDKPFGRMLMAHLIADSTVELMGMVRLIGVQTKWIQHPGTWREHFDICKTKRKRAIFQGAIPISNRELAAKISARRA